MAHSIEVISQQAQFDALLASNSLVVVKFTASWCGK
jgi:thiol:disulfide interchange protein